jgi:hypothetical protein
MENYIIWLISAITLSGLAINGIFVYSQQKLRKQVNMKEVLQLFWIIFILKILDVLSTIYFTHKIGIEYEGNILAKFFMLHLGIVPGIILLFIISLPLMFFWFVLMNFIFNKPGRRKGMGWIIFKALMIAIGVIVPLINLSV